MRTEPKGQPRDRGTARAITLIAVSLALAAGIVVVPVAWHAAARPQAPQVVGFPRVERQSPDLVERDLKALFRQQRQEKDKPDLLEKNLKRAMRQRLQQANEPDLLEHELKQIARQAAG